MSSPPLATLLTPQRGLLFRITHRDNLRHLLENGLHCARSATLDLNYVTIGNEDLIARRPLRQVLAGPGGTLADYVPFYFTPCSPMLYNILTGYKGLRQRSRAEIAVLVTSLDRLEADEIPYVIADRHAYLEAAQFWEGQERCHELPWDRWQARDFKRDPNDPTAFERYQAEALVYKALPRDSLQGIVVYDDATADVVGAAVQAANCAIPVLVRPKWYP